MNAETPVKEIMTKEVIVVAIDDPVAKVEDIFESNPIHHVVVLEEGQLRGIISKSDLLRIYRDVAKNGPPKMDSMTAKEIMIANPMIVDPDDTIGLVSDIILANKFHSLPVVEDGELLGIVTNHDLIKYSYQ